MKTKFSVCRHCGNFTAFLHDAGVPVMCCGEKMEVLVPNTQETGGEKHLPVVTVNGNEVTVSVGAVSHPMLDNHFIQWVYLETEKGGQFKKFHPGDATTAKFILEDDKPCAVYAYCNLHGLWMAAL